MRRRFTGVHTAVCASLCLLACQALGTPIPATAQDAESHVRRTVAVMGTLGTVETWAGDRETARGAADAVIREIERTEALLSTWREDSELSLLNRSPVGVAVRPPPELGELLREAFRWSEASGGAFHPAVGPLIDAWDLRGAGRQPAPAELTRALGAAGPAGFTFDDGPLSVTRMDEEAWMDAGGFGKGAALRFAADSLMARGIRRARVDLGGQLMILGREPVTVGVAHPARRTEVAATLRFTEGSVATSGQSERFVEVNGRRLGHIIDPRSGRPVAAWGSVTVLGADALAVDMLSTALYVLGPVDGMDLAHGLDDVAVLFLEDTGAGLRATFNAAMEPFLGDVPGNPRSRGTETTPGAGAP